VSTYYIRRNHVLHGPFTIVQIQAGLEGQQLSRSDQISAAIGGPWETLGEFLPRLQRSASNDPFRIRPGNSGDAAPASVTCRTCGTSVPGTAGACPKCGSALGIQSRLTAFVRNASTQAKKAIDGVVAETRRAIDEKDAIVVNDTVVFGRSADLADWVIPDPNVSPIHARVVQAGGTLTLHPLRSRTGTIVNGVSQSARQPINLKDGDTIQIGSATFVVRGTTLVSTRRTDHAHLRCEHLTRVVEAADGSRQTILNDVTLNIPPKSFAVLLGPSGSGKSTLLSALNGRACATSGRVLFNQEDLYANYNRLRNRIANVPQKDNLHFELTLRKSLSYAAMLKLPRDTGATERAKLVAAAIDEVGMTGLCDARMKFYSGGQVKRASVAHEILSRPSLICVDEATSGLDEHSDREIMGLLREIADRGKTILCITHNLANVQEFADTVVIMATDGYLAFVGSPVDALQYFSIDSLSELYLRLKEEPGEYWGKKWKTFVEAETRKGEAPEQRRMLNLKRERVSPLQHLGMALLHGQVVFRRVMELALLDKVACGVMCIQPLLVFAVIYILFGVLPSEDTPEVQLEKTSSSLSISFLLVVSAFWFGCSNSAREVVKERSLYEKERHAGLSAAGYLGAKAAWLLLVTLTQSLALLWGATVFTGMDGELISYLPAIASIAACGTAVGLCISVFAPNSDVAVTTVPLVLIPQVVLGGLLKAVDGLSELLASVLVPCYWAFGGMANAVCHAMDIEVKEFATLEPMLAPQSPYLSLFALAVTSVTLLVLSGLALNGVKVGDVLNSEYVKAGKVKAMKALQRTTDAASRPRPAR
jgi:ABC-type multidrug transport system ATPase subunit